MKVVIAGGIGQLGGDLVQRFVADGHDVVVLARSMRPSPGRVVLWDGQTLGTWARELDGADVLINLAGRSVNCRYNPQNRKEIMDSRVASTRVLGEAVAQTKSPVGLWLQSSTATIYAHTYGAPNDEATGVLGGNEPGAPDTWNFSIDVAKSWEAAANKAKPPGTRMVLLRSAMVMAPTPGGAFAMLLGLARFGLGGSVAGGRQFMSWVHTQDFYRAINWIITHKELQGPVNIATPNPLPQCEFMREIRKAWGMPVGLPATAWMVEVGTFILRSESELILKSRRVIPGKLSASGFTFTYPDWAAAAKDLCRLSR